MSSGVKFCKQDFLMKFLVVRGNPFIFTVPLPSSLASSFVLSPLRTFNRFFAFVSVSVSAGAVNYQRKNFLSRDCLASSFSLLTSSAEGMIDRSFQSVEPGSSLPLQTLSHTTSSHTKCTSSSTPRILSVQSHTVFGFVGNKAVTFPLQTMGCNVDAVNTITLSNHPAYQKGTKGQSLPGEVMASIFEGLEANDLLRYDGIMTGYTREASHLEEISKVIKKIQENNPSSLFLCDPVLGDNGQFYVPKDLVDRYTSLLLPQATIVKVNAFEAQVLGSNYNETTSSKPIESVQDAIAAAIRLHSYGPRIVMITGNPFRL
jgi:hypothetical protein